jgi:hypothetical protein
VSDVFAFDGSPAVWNESLTRISGISALKFDQGETKKLTRLGPGALSWQVGEVERAKARAPTQPPGPRTRIEHADLK